MFRLHLRPSYECHRVDSLIFSMMTWHSPQVNHSIDPCFSSAFCSQVQKKRAHPLFCLSRSCKSVCHPSIWPVHGFLHFYKITMSDGSKDSSLSRKLINCALLLSRTKIVQISSLLSIRWPFL